MKTLKSIMAIVMVIILASCGKSFDTDKAQKLCDQYENEGFDDKDWDKFINLYEEMQEYNIEMMKKQASKVTSDMDWDDVHELGHSEELEDFFDAANRMYRVSESYDVPDNVAKRVKAADKKSNKAEKKIEKEIRKKING